MEVDLAVVHARPLKNFDIGEEVVSPVLWSRGIRHLDVVALSHAHSDHMGGLSAVLANFRPNELWVGNNPPVPPYTDLLEEARDLGVQVRTMRAGNSATLGSTNVHVLAPLPDYSPGMEPNNNDSLVLRIAYRNTSVLLEGDAEAPIERGMLSEQNMQSTLLKVGHHGSDHFYTARVPLPHFAAIRHNLLRPAQSLWASARRSTPIPSEIPRAYVLYGHHWRYVLLT